MDVKTLCLAVLHGREASGYEIRKAFEEGPFSHFQRASFGSIYPALTRAAAEGLVTATEEQQDGRPDKKVYRLTEAGEAALKAACHSEPEPDLLRSDFLFLTFFARFQSPERVARLVDDRIAWYRQNLADLEACTEACDAGGPGHTFTRRYGEAVYRAGLAYLETNRDQFIESLKKELPKAAE